jgi:hypothetical protein
VKNAFGRSMPPLGSLPDKPADGSKLGVAIGRFLADTSLESLKKSIQVVAQSAEVLFGKLFCVAHLDVFPPASTRKVCRQAADNQCLGTVTVLIWLRVFDERKQVLGWRTAMRFTSSLDGPASDTRPFWS